MLARIWRKGNPDALHIINICSTLHVVHDPSSNLWVWELKVERRRIDAFELWCWRRHLRLLRVPWTGRRSNQSILREINTEYSLEGLMVKLKLQYFGHSMWRTDSLEKTVMLGMIEESGVTEDEMVGWHHGLNGHEFEQTPGESKRQGNLVCCSPWSHKESDTTEQLNNTYCWWEC